MLELNHAVPEHWGLCPHIPCGDVLIPVYDVTMALAFIAGLLVYRINALHCKVSTDQALPVILGAAMGGVLGAKIPIWLLYLPDMIRHGWRPELLLSGRTVAGGLIGGWLGVWFVKRVCRIRTRYGNLLAPGIAAGMAIGRIGCFLTGCCYGRPTHVSWWGVDFGDHLLRHPTQLYEVVFCMAAFALLQPFVKTARPGLLMTRFLLAYFVFRFMEEFLRPHTPFRGLTPFQWLCLLGLALMAIKTQISPKQDEVNHV